MTTERLYDLGERLILMILAATFVGRFIPYLGENPHLWIPIASELLVVAFIVARPWNSPISTRPRDFIIAVAGTSMPMFVAPVGASPENLTLAWALMLVGALLSLSGKIALNRRFGMVAANRGVQVRGPFRLVRHPIYAGYALTHVGFLIANPYWWNFMVYLIAFMLQISRILVEEETLRKDDAYQSYAQKVRFRLVPGVY